MEALTLEQFNNLTPKDQEAYLNLVEICQAAFLNVAFKKLKVAPNKEEKKKIAQDIRDEVIRQIGTSVYTTAEILKLTENEGILVAKDSGSWYYWDTKLERPNKYEFGGTLEDSAAIDELRNSKINYKMLDWKTMPTNITDKKTFYHEVSKVFVNNPTQAIYMYGTQTELATFFEIWGKPKGLIATHAIISIRPLSNESSRVSFKIYLTSSNDNNGNIYELAVSGFSGTYLGDTGWVNLKQTEESVTAEPNTTAVRQSDGGLLANTNLSNPDDMELTNAKYVRQKIEEAKTDATDLFTMIDNPYDGLVIDLTEDGNKVEIHLDGVEVEKELIVKRYDSKKQMVILDDAEVQLLKGLRVWIEFQYNGTLMTQHQDIRFPSVSTNAVVFLGQSIPNPQIFSDTIIAQYNKNVSEVSLQTTGSGIPTIMKIIDVKGII